MGLQVRAAKGLQDKWFAAVVGSNRMPTIEEDPQRHLAAALASAEPEDLAPRFRERVCVASMAAAVAIANEDPSEKNHAARAAFAREVLNNPFAKMGVLALALSAAVGLDASASDEDIDSGLASIWNAFAGA